MFHFDGEKKLENLLNQPKNKIEVLFLEGIIVACITSVATLIGVIITQTVAYKIQQRDRLQGIEESRIIAAQEKQALNDRLDVIEDKLDLYGDKLDKHNGFEGRIIVLETLVAERLQKG